MYHTTYLSKIIIPKQLIVLILALLSGFVTIAQQATTYDEAIIYADKKLSESKLLDAKAYYQQAIKLKPGDEYAKKQINTIVDRMKAAMAVEDEYYDIIDLGDELLDQNKLSEAISQYKKAIEIIPNDEYALSKIREIEEFQKSEKEKIETFDKAMSAGKTYLSDGLFDRAIEEFTAAAEIFPEKESPLIALADARNKKEEYQERETRYLAKFEEANRYFLISNYVESLKLYIEAKEIMPEQSEVKEKVKMLTPLAEKEEKFNRIIEKADDYYIDQDFISAKKEYIVANNLWPEKSYPGDMISKIDEKLQAERANLDQNYNQYIVSGDSLFSDEDYSLALGKYNLALNLKPDEDYPKNKITEINSIFADQEKEFEDNYNAIIAGADSSYKEGEYAMAINKYNNALSIKPDDTYPKDQLKKIEEISEQLAAEEKLDNEYNALINTADELFNSTNYELAQSKYTEAQSLKPEEEYPAAKLSEITQLLADAEAIKKLNEEYNAIITSAEQLYDNDKLTEAKNTFMSALELKPAEILPKARINAIDSIILVREKEAEIRSQFDGLLTEGDNYREKGEYDMAIASYDAALELIPDESSASSKKSEVLAILENIRLAAELQKNYNEAVTKGDLLFEEGSFELAKVEYVKARSLKSEEEYPRARLADIEVELERLEAEKEKRFEESIASADIYFDQGQWAEALKKYQIASSIKPTETHPKQRIADCEKYIAERKALLLEEYKIAIAEADKLHNSKAYDKAILAFRKAQAILPEETYPTEMISQISKFIEENSIVDVINTVDTVYMGATDRFEFEPIKINVRKSNYIFLRAKNLGSGSTKLIFSYGSDGSKNGGFVVQVVEGDEYNDYIIRVGNQYKWFSEDNNWFTIHPENGDVQINLLRISKGY